MSHNSREVGNQLRDAQSKLRAAETALAGVKRQRTKFSIWSAVGGFLLFAVGGHWFPGYQLDSTAIATANDSAANAVSTVMAELCAERFLKASGLESRLASLRDATGDWNKTRYVREGVWAKTPDGEQSDQATAGKCAALISERIPGEPEKAS